MSLAVVLINVAISTLRSFRRNCLPKSVSLMRISFNVFIRLFVHSLLWVGCGRPNDAEILRPRGCSVLYNLV